MFRSVIFKDLHVNAPAHALTIIRASQRGTVRRRDSLKNVEISSQSMAKARVGPQSGLENSGEDL